MVPAKSSVASRFVSASEVESNANNSSAASAEYDPRSLYERLQTNKEAKDAVLDEKYKLSNQFRGIDDAEAEFLQGVERERRREEEERRKGERGELERFRVAKATSGRLDGEGGARVGERVGKDSSTPAGETGAAKTNKKKRKANSSALLGVVKKKPSQPPSTSASTATTSSSATANASTTHSSKPSS